MKRQYVYLKGTEYKTFTNWSKMREWAVNESHNGTYYVSTFEMTFKYTREEVLLK